MNGNYLALDTTGGYLSVAARKGNRTVRFLREDAAAQHSVLLMGAAEGVLAGADLSVRECDFFCAVTGPGSFTGIRIGISAAKGFCTACGKPSLGVTAFSVIAHAATGEGIAAVPAGGGFYYVCAFDGEKRLSVPARLPEREFLRFSEGRKIYGCGGLPAAYEKIDPGLGLARAVEAAGPGDFSELAAFYMKKSQAEEERLKREAAAV